MKRISRYLQQRTYLWYFLGFFALIELLNVFTGRILNQYSIVPRDLSHIAFIFSSPFLHGSLSHFFSNITTLAVFALLVSQFAHKAGRSASKNALSFFTLTLLIIGISGLCVWLFARPAHHLGASGLLYGYFGYLVLAGWLQNRISLFLISIMVAVFYGTIVWGILPSNAYVSWESHFFGFLSGLSLAWFKRQHP